MPKTTTAPAATDGRIGLTEAELATELGVSLAWLQHDRTGARRLPFFKIGRMVRYNRARVLQALAALEEGGAAA